MIDAVTRASVRDNVDAKDDAAVTRIDPPRCEDLLSNEWAFQLQRVTVSLPNMCERLLELYACNLKML